MSEEEFEVRGPHEEALEGEASEWDAFSSKIAVTTAILATLGALFSYQAGSTQNEAAMLKNDAAIKKTEAENQWSYYESKGSKHNLAELALLIPNSDHDKYTKDAARYETEKRQLKNMLNTLKLNPKVLIKNQRPLCMCIIAGLSR